jgi:hypothetical protein
MQEMMAVIAPAIIIKETEGLKDAYLSIRESHCTMMPISRIPMGRCTKTG